MDPQHANSELDERIRGSLPGAAAPPPFEQMWSRAKADVRRRRIRRMVLPAAAAMVVVAATWNVLRGPLDRTAPTAADGGVDFAVLELEVERQLQPIELFWSSPTQFLADDQVAGQGAFDDLLPAATLEN